MAFLRRWLAITIILVMGPLQAHAATSSEAGEVLNTWYRLVLELVRHTATYSPPVASRSFAYLGVTAYEAVASGSDNLQSLAGQLNDLGALPKRQPGAIYDEAVVVNAAMTLSVHTFFHNTGPTGQRAMEAMAKKLDASVSKDVAPDVLARSRDYGTEIARHIFTWSEADGGAVIENMGFPLTYELTKGPAHWVPTSLIRQQQAPLLPHWGKNRPFAMPSGATCTLPAPPTYSEDKTSQFFKEAQAVYDTSKTLTDEQKTIARFWSDDPMLSPTPPGHWISIAWEILERDNAPLDKRVDVMARLGITVADAFIGCWDAKFAFDFVRPVTIIKKLIDPKWETLLITPPFPEYPSGHSTQSGAAAVVLTALFGENFTFEDSTHIDDGIPPRTFKSFWDAAEEAGISRLYGGIHFQSAIDRGLDQGRCIGAYAVKLKTRK